jgi:hypothetical protein
VWLCLLTRQFEDAYLELSCVRYCTGEKLQSLRF